MSGRTRRKQAYLKKRAYPKVWHLDTKVGWGRRGLHNSQDIGGCASEGACKQSAVDPKVYQRLPEKLNIAGIFHTHLP